MNEQEIRNAQQQAHDPDSEDWDLTVANLQKMIDSGQIWKMEGSAGRAAIDALKSGTWFLPEKSFKDYYGNTVPSRKSLEPETVGTLENSSKFWSNNEI